MSIPLKCFEVENLCGTIPSYDIGGNEIEEFRDLQLSEAYDADCGSQVDILVGLDLYHDFFTGLSI